LKKEEGKGASHLKSPIEGKIGGVEGEEGSILILIFFISEGGSPSSFLISSPEGKRKIKKTGTGGKGHLRHCIGQT